MTKMRNYIVVTKDNKFILLLLVYYKAPLLLVIMAAPSNLVKDRVPKIRFFCTCEVNRKINFGMLNIEHDLSSFFVNDV